MREKALFSKNRELLGTGLFLALAVAVLFLMPPEILVFLENRTLDAFQRSTAATAPSSRVVFLDIDEASLARFGQWPWPRYRVAELARTIAAAKPSAVAFDIAFVEGDRTSLSHLSGELRRDLGYDLSLSGAPKVALDGDRAFSETLRTGPFLLGYKFNFDGTKNSHDQCRIQPATVLLRGGGGEGFFEANGIVCALPQLAESAGSGFFNAVADTDGLLRRAPLLIRYRDAYYPNLALAAYMKAEGIDRLTVDIGPLGPTALHVGERNVPVDRRGRMLINFRGPGGTYRRISAADVLEGNVPPQAFSGKIVLVGTTATGLLDFRPTPMDPAHPGTEILANILDNLERGDPADPPPWGLAAELAAALGAVAFATFLSRKVRPLWGLSAVLVAVLALFLFSRAAYGATRIVLSPVLPSLALVAAYLGLIAVRTWLAEREIRRRNEKILRTQDALIQSMAQMVEMRHHGTGGHIQRTSRYVGILADELRKLPKYVRVLDDETVDAFRRLAPLHDIGKVGVPDSVLMKRGGLNPEERAQMNMHPEYGAKTIHMAIELIGDDSFLKIGEELALSHQERWNGSGYPRGLKGEDIPLAGRLMAVADAYDALVSVREYKSALPHEEAVAQIRKGRGVVFDPEIVDAFLARETDFSAVAAEFAALPG